MEFKLSSGNYDIVACGEAFLFEDCGNFVIEIDKCDGSDFHFSIVINFITDESSNERKVTSVINDKGNVVTTNFVNLNRKKDRILKPIQVATIDDRELYFILETSYYKETGNEVRTVKYTFFHEKKKEMRND